MRTLKGDEKIVEKKLFNKTIRMTEDGKFIAKSETIVKMYIGAIVFLVVGLLLTWH